MPLRIMQFIDALHHATVPKLSVIVRKSYGMAHCNMLGANMNADCLLAWPTAGRVVYGTGGRGECCLWTKNCQGR